MKRDMNVKLSDAGRLLKLDTSDVKIEYQTGATYYGCLSEKKRSGQGVFRWPNGSCYKGDFVENKRHGDGVQEWADGSLYVGQFKNDCRDGYGRHTWCSGEVYEGLFCLDKRHGKGIYRWPDGTKYEGLFYNDLKDGFGMFVFADGKRFEGLYKKGVRSGPGILLYRDGCQDVGIWKEERLVKLCSVMENAFIFHHFPDYYVNAGEQLPLKVRKANSALADTRNPVDSKQSTVNLKQESDTQNYPNLSQIPKTFPYTDILDGVRNTSHGPKGPCELASEGFLHAAGKGDCIRATHLLEKALVHVDVADKTGYAALLAASVNCHRDVVNCILDYGGNVNILNNEGLSALAACHVLFYTKHTWKHNIAEAMAEENLFNSVRWDIPSGTFIQRKYKINNNNNTKRAMNHHECGNEILDRTVDNKVFCVTETKTKDSNALKTNSRDCYECIKCSKYSDVNNVIKGANVTNENENGDKYKTLKKLEDNNYGVKQFIDEQLNKVDKNIYINEFLSRTASAMSNQGSFLSHENMEVCMEKCSLDKREHFNPDIRNSGNFIELNNVKDCIKETKSVTLRQDPSVSLPCSIQNAFSSSMQVSGNTDDEADSLNSIVQQRQRLLTQQRRPHLESTVRLLLRRGADPNCSSLPMPVLFFAVKAADTAAVEVLLNKGASTHARLSVQELGISPLHIAVALPSDAVAITELLLNAEADPSMRDFAFGTKELGRTPLHIACCREDNDEVANRLILLLLHHKANPDVLCQGHSALSLAIASGNDIAVDTLLKHHADPSLPLTHGVGSALCAAVSFPAERRRRLVDRMRLVNRLVRSGANILAPIVISNEHAPGTVVDYAYCVFYQDRRIAYTPYHALTGAEREIYVARRNMLDHLSELLRTYVLKKEKKLLDEQLTRAKSGIRDELPETLGEENNRAVSFCFDDSEVQLRENAIESSFDNISLIEGNISSSLSNETRLPDCGLRVTIVQTPSDHMSVSRQALNSSKRRQLIRKNRFRYCYECGRSVAVRLSPCTRCKEVYYCSRTCKLKAWNSRHKEECVKLSGESKNTTGRRTDSPTPATNAIKDSSILKHSDDVNSLYRSKTTSSKKPRTSS